MTVTVGIIGHSERGPVNESIKIVRWGQFIVKFGSFSKAKVLAHAVHGFFNNGGKKSYVVNVAEDENGELDVESGLKAFDEIEDIEFVVAPGQTDDEAHEKILDHCSKHKNRFAILDLIGDIEDEESGTQEEEVEKEEGSKEEEETETQEEDREEDIETEEEPKGIYALPDLEDTEDAIYLFPWLWVKDPVGKHDDPKEDYVKIPASGHVAGLYASGDEVLREVPHDKKIQGVVSLTYKITDADQRILNDKGIECIRFHPKELIAIGSHKRFYDSNV